MLNFMRLKEILDKPALAAGLEKYRCLMAQFRETDVSIDSEFQRMFREFYQMRAYYSEVFAWRYFGLMEELKKADTPPTFDTVFRRVRDLQGTYELSFSSKLLHTLDPKRPIWDSVVAIRHFGFKTPSVRKHRSAACVRRYEAYQTAYYAYLSTQEGKALTRFFDGKFPENGISEVKKLDFILSMDR